ncbi:uncharacterized protein LOC135928818 [Gordionus sp. m RMFG-2023]|uniref:uncharacterized protein LOC135928818 n=1 Tax=Gordionus sp. m RMFG-2023 TaxID=3053472 RepID=UPI0031FC5306
MGISTIQLIIITTCTAIFEVLENIHLKPPNLNDLKIIADQFEKSWNFPNCVGAIDGKHIEIRNPAKSGSLYYNYKQYFSIIPQALVDGRGRFMVIAVGSYGSESDGGVYSNSLLSKMIENGDIDIPPPKILPNSNIILPHVFVADDAYPLKYYIMKPYKGKLSHIQENFNYRLSRARRMVECTFGILASKWRILNRALDTNITNSELIIKTCALLHNLVIDKENVDLRPKNTQDPKQNNYLWNNQSIKNPSKVSKDIRDAFSEYFYSNKLSWQL